MGSLLLIAALVLFGLSGYIFLAQDRMIYFPRRYSPELVRGIEALGFSRISYETSQGQQSVFFLPPCRGSSAGNLTVLNEELPHLVVIFCGNGSTGFDWHEFALLQRSPHAAFLLFDYPGYGLCEGRPSPSTILESSRAAMRLAAEQSGLDLKNSTSQITLVGHSLGAAAAFQLAAESGARRVVAVAPFTTMMEMAKRSVGPGFAWLLRHRFDNIKALEKIAVHHPGLKVSIFHGESDDVIPFEMGRRLADLARELSLDVEFESVPGLGHNDIIDTIDSRLKAALMR